MLFWLSFLPEWQAWIGTLGLLKAMKLNSPPKEKKKKPHFLPIVTSLFPLMRFSLT